MKKIILLLLVSGFLISQLDVISMEQQEEQRKAEKRKRKEAEEPEKELEHSESEPKRQRQEVPSLLQLTGLSVIEQQVGLKEINDFLQVKNEKEAQELQKKYEEILPLDVKEKIKKMVNAPIPGNPAELTAMHRATTPLQVKQLFFLGARFFGQRTTFGETPLLIMLRNGYKDAASEFLKNVMKQELSTVEQNKIKELLLITDRNDTSVLYYALMVNAVDVVEILMTFPKIVNWLNRPEQGAHETPLMIAAIKSPSSIPLLVKGGADVNLDIEGTTALSVAAGKTLEAVQQLIRLGANTPQELLAEAFYSNDERVLKFLLDIVLKSNSSINQDLLIKLGLQGSEILRAVEKAKVLVEYGVDVNFVRGNLYPLAAAIFEDYVKKTLTNPNGINYKLISYLVSVGAKLRRADYEIIMKSNNQELKDVLKGVQFFENEEEGGD